MSNLRYISADLHSCEAMLAADIVRMPFRSGSFDVVLCIHVFEHVVSDSDAMREVRRVIAPGGWSILQVPIDSQRDTTFEDPTVTAPEERQRLFGQKDHLRQYGLDYRLRLEEAGFAVAVIDYCSELGPEALGEYCLANEDIYLCREVVDASPDLKTR